MAPPKRPDLITVGPLTVYPERPPTERDARWWWRGYSCVKGDKRKPVFGRGTPAEIAPMARRWVHDNIDAPTKAPTTQGYTVRDACELWLGMKATERDAGQIAARSYAAYQNSVRRLISRKREGTIGEILLDTLEEDEIRGYALARATAGHAPKTVNDDVSVLMMAIGWMRRRRKTTCPDLRPKPLEAAPKRPTRTPTREEILALIDVLPERYSLLVWLMYATGARIGEIAHLEWADVDLEAGLLHLGRHEGAEKTGEREAPIALEVVERLEAWRDRGEEPKRQGWRPVPEIVRARWVIGVTPSSAISRTMKLLPDACAEVAERLGLEPDGQRFTSHAIRRWAADEMGRTGGEASTAASQLGHSPEEMARRYRRPTTEDRRRVVAGAKLGAVLAFRREP